MLYSVPLFIYKIINMDILKLLSQDEFYGESEAIEIAKGKYEYPNTMRKLINKFKRKYRWLKK
tara:strand:- start:821 stop:1009 length:189 start_codon:yes stop_codon:yes gene_type:complete